MSSQQNEEDGKNSNNSNKYWKMPSTSYLGQSAPVSEDTVIIHVCDENQQISRDFCCKRDILIQNMKYFQKFLTENENGYDDIDISVHCDVEIFEWLMTYIHEPNNPPKIDKSMIVSILISSEFLQMDTLVEHCIAQMISSLNEIIKLPIDLSCVSEKLINRMASFIHPKQLAEIKDRKDKILTKLYKRRVELDFSRKGSASKSVPSYSFIATQTSRSIAASLTCCRYCGMVYLENYVTSLVCRRSPPCIDYRGRLASRHSSITGWSLTTYLKTLHAGGMGWDAIYWHVWAACIILKVGDVTISALEVDRYNVESDGLAISKSSTIKDYGDSDNSGFLSNVEKTFSLAIEDESMSGGDSPPQSFRMLVSRGDDFSSKSETSSVATTPTLNPNRPPEILTSDIFELICSQMKFIVGVNHKNLIQSTMQAMITSSRNTESFEIVDETYESLWGVVGETEGDEERRRGRSPGRPLRTSSMEPRKQTVSLSKVRQSSPVTVNDTEGSGGGGNPTDFENTSDGIAALSNKKPSSYGERRSRSSSTGKRLSSANASLKGHFSASREKLRSRGSETSRSEGISALPSRLQPSPGSNSQKDDFLAKQLETLRALPPDLYYRIAQHRLPIYGIFLSPSPLQLHPQQLDEMLMTVSETNLSDHKRLEWELDLMREYDEKKMDRIERYMILKRNPSLNQSLLKGKITGKGAKLNNNISMVSNNKVDNSTYYKDRGRQPIYSIN